MDKKTLISYIEAYADAKTTNNKLLVEFAAGQLTKALDILYTEETNYDSENKKNR